MDLNAYIDSVGMAAFARSIGVTPAYSYQLKDDAKPSIKTAVAIERVSGAKVTCEEMLPHLTWVRVKDKRWPHKSGRPLLDMTTTPTEA